MRVKNWEYSDSRFGETGIVLNKMLRRRSMILELGNKRDIETTKKWLRSKPVEKRVTAWGHELTIKLSTVPYHYLYKDAIDYLWADQEIGEVE